MLKVELLLLLAIKFYFPKFSILAQANPTTAVGKQIQPKLPAITSSNNIPQFNAL
jgi:hypothetical protein